MKTLFRNARILTAGLELLRGSMRIDGDRIELLPPFDGVRYVRYCWRDNARSNIFNSGHLPLGPFFTEIHGAE